MYRLLKCRTSKNAVIYVLRSQINERYKFSGFPLNVDWVPLHKLTKGSINNSLNYRNRWHHCAVCLVNFAHNSFISGVININETA